MLHATPAPFKEHALAALPPHTTHAECVVLCDPVVTLYMHIRHV